MCGIYGVSKSTDLFKRMSPILALHMESRGSDSWGVTDGLALHKVLGSISETWDPHEELEGPLFHTRHGTTGAKTQRNAHPFRFEHEGKVVIGAHNGMISNWAALKNKYSRNDLECDSENIFMHLAEGKDLGEIDGYGAVVWYEYQADAPEKRIRYFSRFNTDSLHFARLDTAEHEIIFCSTTEAIECAVKMAGYGTKIEKWYKTEPLKRYFVQNDHLMVDIDLPWKKNPVGFSHASSGGSHYANGSSYAGRSVGNNYGGQFNYGDWDNYDAGNWRTTSRGDCLHKGCSKKALSDDFFCKECFEKLEIEYCGAANA